MKHKKISASIFLMSKAQGYFLRVSVAILHDRTNKTLQRSSWRKDAGEKGMCHLYVPTYRIAEKALPVIQGAAMAGGLLLLAPAASLTAAPVLAVSTGGMLSNLAYAGEIDFSATSDPIRNKNKTLIVTFSSTYIK